MYRLEAMGSDRVPKFEDLPVPRDFQRDEDPAYYGRYRLWFDQVAPFVDDYRAFVPVRDQATAELREAVALLEAHPRPVTYWPFRLIERGDDGNPVDGLALCFEMLADICYIDMRNLHLATDFLAFGLHDARWFTYSSGDGPDTWLDEVRVEAGRLRIRRWLGEPYMRQSRLALYRRLCSEVYASDQTFRRFVVAAHRAVPRGFYERGEDLAVLADAIEKETPQRS